MSERRGRIHEKHDLSKTRRCELLDVPRSSAYYRRESVSEADLAVMRLIDEIHLQLPFYGSRRCVTMEERGHTVNRKRVQRLMREMDLRALYPRRRTSQPGKGHFTPTCSGTCPSSVRTRPGQVTSATSRWPRGSCTWWRSWTGTGCCHGGCRTPWIRTSVSKRWRKLYSALKRRRSSIPTKGPSSPVAFTDVLKDHAIAISMDGKGRWVDNVFVERLWRSVKYEDVYLRAYETPTELRAGLARYFGFYNTRRRHSALDRRTPDAVYFDQAHRDLAA